MLRAHILSLFLFVVLAARAANAPKTTALPEVMVESNRNKIVHILAYVRDHSSISNYSDTVFLYREKLVDFMLVPNEKINFKGWRIPRTLLSNSYYRFTNAQGLDSVSDEYKFHFTWTDWMGMPPLGQLPKKLRYVDAGVDTIHGKYSAVETWKRDKDVVVLSLNLLAGEEGRKWCPAFDGFFKEGVDFYDFKATFNYENVLGADLSPLDLTSYSFNIESFGRGHEMRRVSSEREGYYFTTSAELYVIDREYLTVKEAKTWQNHKFDKENVELFEPASAPPLDSATLALIDRVGELDKEAVRLELPPNEKLGSGKLRNDNFSLGKRALFIFKQFTGISRYKFRKDQKKKWNNFKKSVKEMNTKRKEAGQENTPPQSPLF